jgi:excisionase family DNA binding protein
MTEMLTVDDVARLVGLTSYTVRAAIRDGELRAAKLRGRWRVQRDDLAAWIDAGQAAALPGAALTMTPATAPAPSRKTPPVGDPRAAVRARRRAA